MYYVALTNVYVRYCVPARVRMPMELMTTAGGGAGDSAGAGDGAGTGGERGAGDAAAGGQAAPPQPT